MEKFDTEEIHPRPNQHQQFKLLVEALDMQARKIRASNEHQYMVACSTNAGSSADEAYQHIGQWSSLMEKIEKFDLGVEYKEAHSSFSACFRALL